MNLGVSTVKKLLFTGWRRFCLSLQAFDDVDANNDVDQVDGYGAKMSKLILNRIKNIDPRTDLLT